MTFPEVRPHLRDMLGEEEGAFPSWNEIRGLPPFLGTRWESEPETTAARVRLELEGPKGHSESTKQDWLTSLLKEDCLFEFCVVAKLTGINPASVVDSKERHLLFHAVSAAAVELLVTDFNLDVHRKSMSGNTAMHSAPSGDVVKALHRAGLPIDRFNNGRCTPIFYVRRPSVARAMLGLGANAAAINYFKHTPLHLVSSHGDWRVLWLLLQAGAGDPNLVAKDGHTCLSLTETILRGVPFGNGGEVSLPRNRGALRKTCHLLRAWLRLSEEHAHSHCAAFEAFATYTAAAAHSRICRNPALSLAAATGLPAEVMTEVLCTYIGPFVEPTDLADPSVSEIIQDKERPYETAYLIPESQASRQTFQIAGMRISKHRVLQLTIFIFSGILVCSMLLFLAKPQSFTLVPFTGPW